MALFEAMTGLKFDDRKTALTDHIKLFEERWLRLAQAVTSAKSDSVPIKIKDMVSSSEWKAIFLLDSLPNIQPYINIINNITATLEEYLKYADIVIKLQDIQIKPRCNQEEQSTIEPAAAFATSSYQNSKVRCWTCKNRGFPGTNHDEKDCRWKKRNQDKKEANATQQEANLAEHQRQCDQE